MGLSDQALWKLRGWIFLFFFPWQLTAMLIGNPAEPALETAGIFSKQSAWCSLRATFFEDYVYQQRLQDTFEDDSCNRGKTLAKFSTNAGILTLNFKDRIDFYGIVGASRLQVNQEIFSKMQFAWGVGSKLILFKTGSFYLGADLKYFETAQKPMYFLCEGLAFNLAGNFALQYSETQAALGICFTTFCIAPYIYASYMIAKFEPDPMTALVRWPFSNVLVDAICKSATTQRRFGLAVGATLLSGEKATLSIESRMFNQNAIDINLEVKF